MTKPMASPSKQAPPKKSGGWGSLLSGAVAGLESRLDTILAEGNDISAEARAVAEATKQSNAASSLAPPRTSRDVSREASRSRTNERLAERLAKATAVKAASQAQSQNGSAVPSRVGSPAVGSARASEEVKSESGDATEKVEHDEGSQETIEQGDEGNTADSIATSSIAPSRVSADSSRPSVDTPRVSDVSSRRSLELTNGSQTKSTPELEADVTAMREEYKEAEKQRQEEMNVYIEKIDALQAKLQYLAKETVAAAKEANASPSSDDVDKRVAEKDEKIALLMQEGESLSKTELRHLQTIKKLRAKASQDEKATIEIKQKLSRAEIAERDLRQKVRRAEVAERQANEKTKQIAAIEKEVEELRVDRENAAELVRSLTTQLKEAKDKAERAETEAKAKASAVDQGRIAALENEVEDAQIEKKLAEDRAQAEVKKGREELEQVQQRFSVRELELKNEVSGLEARLEAMRSRAEEASAEGREGSIGESSIALLRQVETLQSQYAQAKENWEVIESSLTARVGALEKERDESSRRETEARKRTRDVTSKARKTDDELENAVESGRRMQMALNSNRDELTSLQSELQASQKALEDARAEFDRQRKVWDTEVGQRVEEERARWAAQHSMLGRGDTNRKTSHTDLAASLRRPGSRATHQDLSALHIHADPNRPASRRSSGLPSATASSARAVQTFSPPLADSQPNFMRQDSLQSMENQTPTIEIGPDDAPDLDEHTPPGFNSPERTINDLTSLSTAPASGPSVQLLERMSALVRRLETEKASFKDELTRITSQRDASRDEVVSLMREVELKRAAEDKVSSLQKEMDESKGRYDASLEMLGEREEEVQELRQDVQEMKRLYRELVEEKLGGGKT